MQGNILSEPVEPPPTDSAVGHLKGFILDGGWEHDDLGNPCARVEIIVNAHRLTLVDDTVEGWTLREFADSPDPEAAFRKVFRAEFGDAAELDHDTLRDFRRALERVGSERIAKVCKGTPISLQIYHSPPHKKRS